MLDNFKKEKARALVARVKRQLDFLLYKIKSNFNYLNESRKRIKTRRSSQF